MVPYCGITNAEPLPRKPNPELVGAAVVVAPGSTVTFVAMIYFQRLSWFCNLTFERPKRPASGTTPCAFGAARLPDRPVRRLRVVLIDLP